MNHLYTFLAIDIARERAHAAAEARRATMGRDERPNVLRRRLANGLVAISRATAATADRLDAYALDDHRRAMSTGK